MSRLINFLIVPLFTCSILGFTTFSYAEAGGGNPGKGQGHAQGNAQGHGKAHSLGKSQKMAKKSQFPKTAGPNPKVVKFSRSDRQAITNYLNANPLPAGTLPPGIAKNIARGKPIPPGIAKVFLPSNIASTLPAYPGYEYRVIGNDVALVNSNTEVVADILTNILR